MEKNKTSLFELFITFAKMGALTFGGGYAMLPMLQRECVDKHGWATEEEMLNYFAIGQCTPGIIAVNTATFIGHKERGVAGAIAATLGMVFPSVVIITLIAAVLDNFRENIYVQKAFSGIRVAVSALITVAVIRTAKKAVNSISTAVIAVLALLLQLILGVSPVLVVLMTVIYGVVVYIFFVRKAPDKNRGGST